MSKGYDAANELLKSTSPEGVTTYTYDLDGNRTRQEKQSDLTDYTYDAAGRMTLIEPIAGDVVLVYNGLGQRVEKTTPTETIRYVYDETRLLQETDGADDVQKEFTFANEEYAQLVSEYGEDAGESSYYLYDGQCSTNSLLNPDQDATDKLRYRAFGLETSHQRDDYEEGSSEYAGQASLHLLGVAFEFIRLKAANVVYLGLHKQIACRAIFKLQKH